MGKKKKTEKQTKDAGNSKKKYKQPISKLNDNSLLNNYKLK